MFPVPLGGQEDESPIVVIKYPHLNTRISLYVGDELGVGVLEPGRVRHRGGTEAQGEYRLIKGSRKKCSFLSVPTTK